MDNFMEILLTDKLVHVQSVCTRPFLLLPSKKGLGARLYMIKCSFNTHGVSIEVHVCGASGTGNHSYGGSNQ